MPADPDRDTKHRIAKFAAWMAQIGRSWHQPDLPAYRNHLLAGGKSPATVFAHLSTVRSNYRRLITDNAIRQALFDQAAEMLDSPADRKALRSVQRIVAHYPMAIGGAMKTMRPHDLRRTYARRLYEAGLVPVAIQQNLGHADPKTTLGYIGELDADKRRAPAIYSLNLAKLNGEEQHCRTPQRALPFIERETAAPGESLC